MAACVWDHEGGEGRSAGSGTRHASSIATSRTSLGFPGTREGQLAQLFGAAGLDAIEETALRVTVEHPTFDEWWEPFTLGVGPAGGYVAGLDVNRQGELRERCRDMSPPPPFAATARAWAARGRSGR